MRIVAALILLLVPASRPVPHQFPAWTIPVPEGTRIIEYEAVPMEERTERIELIEDLVINPQADSQCMLYRPTDVAVGPDGGIYVVDNGANCVYVFNDEGECQLRLGQEGQGPGEFQNARLVAVAGDLLVVAEGRKLSLWTLDGEHVEDHAMEPLMDMLGIDDGTLVAVRITRGPTGLIKIPGEALSLYSAGGTEMVQYADIVSIGPEVYDPSTDPPVWMIESAVSYESGPKIDFAVDPNSSVYVTASMEYQLLKMASSGSITWAIRVKWDRADYNDELKAKRLDLLRLKLPDAKKSDVEWPDLQRALGALRIDGHGHVFVFPIIDLPPGDNDGDKPVDVYSSDGERIFSGMISEVWDAAHGNFVYKLRLNNETEEHEVVRYRLVEPF